MTDKNNFALLLSGFLFLALLASTVVLIAPVSASPDAGDDWTIPIAISQTSPWTDTLIGFNDRAIAVDDDGYVHVAMYGETNFTTGNNEISYATNKGGSWNITYVTQVNLTGYDQNRPVIALDSNGVVHIAWAGFPPGDGTTNRDIFYSNNQGGTFSTPYNMTQTDSLDEKDPTMVIDSQDGVHIAFINTLNGNATRYVYRSPSGVWSSVQEINTGIFDSVLDDVSIAVDSNDKVHIAFIGAIGGTSDRDVFLCNNVAGSWSTPYNVSGDFSSTEEINLSMDIDNNDQIHLSWAGPSSGYWGIFYSSGSGTSFSSPVNFSQTYSNVNDMSLVVDYSNNAHIVFSQDFGPWFRLYYINNTFGFNQAINITQPADDERLPHLQIDRLGYAHVIFYMDPQVIFYLNSTDPVGIIPQLALSSPSDQEITLGEDAEITWVVTSSAYPHGEYQLHLDGNVTHSGTWNNNENLTLNITDLDQAGTYNVTIYAQDGYGNSVNDQVQIQVNALQEADYTLYLILGGVAGAVVIVGVAAFLLRGRKPT